MQRRGLWTGIKHVPSALPSKLNNNSNNNNNNIIIIIIIMFKENVRNFLEKSMEKWKLSLTSNGEDLGEVDVKRGIFPVDSLPPLLFVLSMVPLPLILRKVNASYE